MPSGWRSAPNFGAELRRRTKVQHSWHGLGDRSSNTWLVIEDLWLPGENLTPSWVTTCSLTSCHSPKGGTPTFPHIECGLQCRAPKPLLVFGPLLLCTLTVG